MIRRWVDQDRDSVRRRYDRIAPFISVFDRLFFVPRDFRRDAVARLGLRTGDSVLDIGCGTGVNLSGLRRAVGPAGHVFGVDISRRMLHKAKALRAAQRWRNVELSECDAADYVAPRPLDGVLMSLSYNTMSHHRSVLRHAWRQLRPGGRLVIMDAKIPDGFGEALMLPFSLWLMRHTMLGNPLIKPWREVATLTGQVDMSERLFGSYYICRAIKPLDDSTPAAATAAVEYPLAAE
jgi:ubiquinone/menaquinone biosynthesis C-methylase UbiE